MSKEIALREYSNYDFSIRIIKLTELLRGIIINLILVSLYIKINKYSNAHYKSLIVLKYVTLNQLKPHQ